MENELKIEIPKGYSVDKVETEDGGIVVRLKQAEPSLPKTWEEFCEMPPKKEGEYFINSYSTIVKNITGDRRDDIDKNNLPNRATAEAVLALCQLIQLRDCYNQGWVPDWENWRGLERQPYCIVQSRNGCPHVETMLLNRHILAFRTKELADEFLGYFKPLIMKATVLCDPAAAKKAYVPKHRVGDQLVNANYRNLVYTVLAVVDNNGVPEYHVAVNDCGVEVISRFIECERMDGWAEPAGPGPDYIGNKQ